jgi:hypothetical protein
VRHSFGAHSDICCYCGMDRPFWRDAGECPLAEQKENEWALREKRHQIQILADDLDGTPEERVEKAIKLYEEEKQLRQIIHIKTLGDENG